MSTECINLSIIIPIYNGEKWINNCFESILCQTVINCDTVHLEVVAYNDSSTDETPNILRAWEKSFAENKIKYSVLTNSNDFPGGVGAAKNVAVENSSGTYLCFQDIDDVMLPRRLEAQLNLAKQHPSALIGCQFRRSPAESTKRFTEWANNLEPEKLDVQIYTSHGPTVIMPTWFCHRSVFDRVGGFSEDSKGTPEDLIFFYNHINFGGKVFRVNEQLLIYTYHKDATTFSVLRDTIWDVRIKHLQEQVLNKWQSFTVWNAGKQGRKFIRSLNALNQNKVAALCDVDVKKVGTKYSLYCHKSKTFTKTFPIIHFSQIVAPIVICVKLGLTKGEFEKNLKSLNLREGEDYILFS